MRQKPAMFFPTSHLPVGQTQIDQNHTQFALHSFSIIETIFLHLFRPPILLFPLLLPPPVLGMLHLLNGTRGCRNSVLSMVLGLGPMLQRKIPLRSNLFLCGFVNVLSSFPAFVFIYTSYIVLVRSELSYNHYPKANTADQTIRVVSGTFVTHDHHQAPQDPQECPPPKGLEAPTISSWRRAGRNDHVHTDWWSIYGTVCAAAKRATDSDAKLSLETAHFLMRVLENTIPRIPLSLLFFPLCPPSPSTHHSLLSSFPPSRPTDTSYLNS